MQFRYPPFGMLMPGRKYAPSGLYKYGFNGKENDNEVIGEGNQQDYGMRVYDPRLGKFLSVDPLSKDYPMLTPYQFASNSPIVNIDLDGEEKKHYLLSQNDGKPVLIHSHDEDIYEKQPIYKESFYYYNGLKIPYKTKVGETTVKNARTEYVVHGIVSYNLGLDGDMGQYQINVTWSFSTLQKMQEAESEGGVGYDKTWSWISSDQRLEVGLTIGLYNSMEAEMETGGMRGLWRGNANLSNKAARLWYLQQEAKIPGLINKKLSLEAQARQAFDLRNNFRKQSRELMKDRDLAAKLDKDDPNMTWDQIIKKYKSQNYSGDNLWKKIIESSQKSREEINIMLDVKIK